MSEYKQYAPLTENTNLVVDTQWGDTGKGTIVDLLAQNADIVARYGGGNNAGHTVRNDRGEFKLNIVPCGVFNEEVVNILADGVVVDPLHLAGEIARLRECGVVIDEENLLVSKKAHLIMPWHGIRDGKEEQARTQGESGTRALIGTTGRGIGPTYADRTARRGLRVGDMLEPDFEAKVLDELAYQEDYIRFLGGEPLLHILADPNYANASGDEIRALAQQALQKGYLDRDQILKQLYAAREVIAPMITNTISVIQKAHRARKRVLGEGAQGALIGLDHGDYPYVTSSYPGATGWEIATAISARQLHQVYGVAKAYMTRVGEGPMPTEQGGKIGAHLQAGGLLGGAEIGTTTGRLRRTGWFDAMNTARGLIASGATSLILTKLDVLDAFPKIKMCVAYELDGTTYSDPADILGMTTAEFARVKPVYRTVDGWQEPTSGIHEYNDLPQKAKEYVETIAEMVGIPLVMISVGPHRDHKILR